jgi:hypothetical protein
VPRRLAALAALLLAVSVGAGCADGAAPAARVGDTIVITDQELLDEVAEWASSPTLLEQVGVEAEGAAPGSYPANLVDAVLTNRILFDLHREQFDALGLAVDPQEEATVEDQLATVLEEVSEPFGTRIVGDLVRVNAVSAAMAESYSEWFADATSADVEVSSRYGRWDSAAGTVVPPEGPRSAPGPVLSV